MNYSELKTAIADWTHRGDLSGKADDFIDLAEADFSRRLRLSQNEGRTAIAVTSGVCSLPTDFAAVRSINDQYGELQYMTPAQFSTNEVNSVTGGFYTIVDDQIRTLTDDDEITLAYWQTIPALSDSNTSNWLLAKHPNLYLFQSLAYAAIYLKDGASFDRWQAQAEKSYVLLKREDQQKTGALEVRAR